MAVKDIKSNLKQTLAVLDGTISGTTPDAGAILDTADFELGLMFALHTTTYVTGTVTILIEESDDSGMASATTVDGDQLIGSLPEATAIVAEGDDFPTVGVISNLRYIQVSVLGDVGADAAASVYATQKGENLPIV